MPSRIRVVVLDRRERPIHGAAAIRLVKSVAAGRSYPKCNWQRVLTEGQSLNLMLRLRVFRERRGLGNTYSEYHKAAERLGTHSPEVKTDRQYASSARHEAETLQLTQALRRARQRPISPADPEEPRPRLRIGIFQ